jgi:hypothetical protein
MPRLEDLPWWLQAIAYPDASDLMGPIGCSTKLGTVPTKLLQKMAREATERAAKQAREAAERMAREAAERAAREAREAAERVARERAVAEVAQRRKQLEKEIEFLEGKIESIERASREQIYGGGIGEGYDVSKTMDRLKRAYEELANLPSQ